MTIIYKRDLDGKLWRLDTDDPSYKAQAFDVSPEYLAWLANGGVVTDLETLEERQRIMRIRIARERNIRAAQEFQMGDHWYQAKDTNKLDLAGILLSYTLAAIGAIPPIPNGAFGTWLTIDNQEVPIDFAFAVQLLVAAQMHVKACEETKRSHIAAMELVEQPGLYNYSSGWPSRYDGEVIL